MINKTYFKKLLLTLTEAFKVKIEKFHYKLTLGEIDDVDYSSLSPIANGDESGSYSRALLWALKNRKKEDIKNIALTGPYGSGKSSILKTFQENYKGGELKFLNISLATFKEEKEKKDAEGNIIESDKTDLLRLIETSILQQIFYHEEDSKIPDSRFKKIKSYSFPKLLAYTFGYSLFLIATANYFYPNLIQSLFKDSPFSQGLCDFIFYAGWIIIAGGLFGIVFKSIRIISSITLNKLKIQNAEIGIGESINKSILNHHIDEILYFFSIRPFNVVIIEDLDRFQQTEIFTKLREINLLLNSSEKTRRKTIVFIYAVRDEMFSDKDRTKFFDFIIPVIPIINSSNSSNIILEKKRKFGYDLSDSFIEDIGFYIDDMRLLHNITNEFFLYTQKLTGLVADKLFAIIIYKNIYPKDFVQLSYNEGHLYELLNTKSIYIQKEIVEIEKQISTLKHDILALDTLFVSNVRELRQFYVLRAMETSTNLTSFFLNEAPITVNELLEDDKFDYLLNNKLQYNKMVANRSYYRIDIVPTAIPVPFSEIEKLVDNKITYQQKIKLVTDKKSGQANSIRLKIQDLERKKVVIRSQSLATVMQSANFAALEVDRKFNKNLLELLLRSGYISEDYHDYISLFHEGSITRADHQFKINVRNRIAQEFNIQLSKIDKLIAQINLIDFETSYILNYSLLDFMLEDENAYSQQLEAYFINLSNESPDSLKFIGDFIGRTTHLPLFIQLLGSYWTNMLNYYFNVSILTEEEQLNILKLVLQYTDLATLSEISNVYPLQSGIENNPDFLEVIHEEQRLKDILTTLSIKFRKINLTSILDKELLKFILDNNHYQINIDMIYMMVKEFGNFDQAAFDQSNYKAIHTSQIEVLIANIEANINAYITNIYLRLENNVQEPEDYLLKIFNHPNIGIAEKLLVVAKTGIHINDLAKVIDKNISSKLVKENKIKVSWENLYVNFLNNDSEISEELVEFINVIENAKMLASTKIPQPVNGETIYKAFYRAIMENNDISDGPFEYISKPSPWWFSDLDLTDASEKKVTFLIQNTVISPTVKSYLYLQENFPMLSVSLIERHKAKMLEQLSELTFNEDELELVLKSSKLLPSEKNSILQTCSEDIISSKAINHELIAKLIVEHPTFTATDDTKMMILNSKHVNPIFRISLFVNLQVPAVEIIESFLESLGGEYAKITDSSKRPKFGDNAHNRALLEKLIRTGYISSFSQKDLSLKVYHKTK